MRTFQLYIRTENAAFSDDGEAAEVTRILREIADKIEADGEAPAFFLTILDVNGNDVGRYAVKEL